MASANLSRGRKPKAEPPGESRRPAVARVPSGAAPIVAFHSVAGARFARVSLGDSWRLAAILVPAGRGSFTRQAREILACLQAILAEQPVPMVLTVQTVFLRDPADQARYEKLMRDTFGAGQPVGNFVAQAPCDGSALAVEIWAVGGESVRVERFGAGTLRVSCDGVKWVHCAGVGAAASVSGACPRTLEALGQIRSALGRAGSDFRHVVRTWFYLGGITAPEGASQRYKELNRARAEFYRDISFGFAGARQKNPTALYPASTGIGMAGDGLAVSCLALETSREDVLLAPLENPVQTPAYVYSAGYSPASPKFSRAMALRLGDCLTTWISGTASIVNSESRFAGDVEGQTGQTIDNIERLISRENFARHGIPGGGAELRDLAKIRVYLKRPEDLAACKKICDRRFGAAPAVYAVADVCRPELLVEIEGVAFSRLSVPRVP